MGAFFRNFLESLLASGISNSATTLDVTSGHGAARFNHTYSADNYLPLAIWDATAYPNPADAFWAGAYEIVHVTGRSTDTLTIVRGRHGTTAQSWSTGAKLSNTIASDFLNDLNQRSSGDVRFKGSSTWAPTGSGQTIPDGVFFVWGYDHNLKLPTGVGNNGRLIIVGAAREISTQSGETLITADGFGNPKNFGGRTVLFYCWNDTTWDALPSDTSF